MPRLSDANCAKLARDIVADDANYHQRFAKDRAAYAAHVKSLGKGEGMVHEAQSVVEPRTAPATKGPSSCAGAGDGAAGDGHGGPSQLYSPGRVARGLSTDAELTPLVVPGLVVYVRGHDGAYEAVETDHRFPTLRRIHVTQRAVADHSIDTLAFALRVVRAKRGNAPAERPQAPFRPAIAPQTDTWAPCSVCGSDVTWTSAVRGSDAARASATHHCRACGNVVCAFCAPAGDQVAGDGIAQFHTLPDKKMALPSQGCLGTVRVCRPCAFNSFNL